MKPVWRDETRKAAAANLHPSRAVVRKVRGLIRKVRLGTKAGFRQTDADRLTREISDAVKKGDSARAVAIAEKWATRAEQTRDQQLLEWVGNNLRRLRHFEHAFDLLAQSKRRDGPKEWDGSDPRGRRLVVERRDADLKTFFVFLSAIDLGLARGARLILLVEDRLIPLLQRTFTDTEVRSEVSEREASHAEADLVTSYEGLAGFLGWDGGQRRKLAYDTAESEALRQRYRAGSDAMLVGITWGSLNIYKDTPGVREWIRLFERASARYVSLQYGSVEATIRTFESKSAVRILVDPTVDQLTDMDRFASQIACLDAVVTVSNTTAHVAGALGVPTFVLLDGKFKRSWPGFGADVPWYQSVRLSRQNAGGWADAFAEAETWLASVAANPRRVLAKDD